MRLCGSKRYGWGLASGQARHAEANEWRGAEPRRLFRFSVVVFAFGGCCVASKFELDGGLAWLAYLELEILGSKKCDEKYQSD